METRKEARKFGIRFKLSGSVKATVDDLAKLEEIFKGTIIFLVMDYAALVVFILAQQDGQMKSDNSQIARSHSFPGTKSRLVHIQVTSASFR